MNLKSIYYINAKYKTELVGERMSSPLISIFLPTHSRLYDGHLERAIISILNQTYDNFELFIIDDGSVDGSKELIEGYATLDERIRIMRIEKNIGLPALITGMAYLQSKGEFLAFAYDDCVLAPNHLDVLLSTMLTSPHLGMVYGQAHIIWADGRRQLIGSPFDEARMSAMNNHIPNVSVLLRRKVVENVGWYDPHFLLSRFYDWDLWVRIARRHPIGFVEKVLAEEHGTRLQDSFGNTFVVFTNLILNYVRQDRTKLLLPSVLIDYDPYQLDFVMQLSAEEQEQASFVKLEHLVKTNHIAGIIDQASEDDLDSLMWKKIVNKNKGLQSHQQMLLFKGLSKYMNEKIHLISEEHAQDQLLIKKLHDSLQEKQSYIDEQQRYIDEQQKYIDSMQK